MDDNAVIHSEMGYAVGCSLGVFYSDDGLIGLRDPEWLQGDLNISIGLFCCIGLMANIARSKIMTCQPV